MDPVLSSNEQPAEPMQSTRGPATDAQDPQIKKGQQTAIWTGAVSIIFGVSRIILASHG